ncbi:MAG: DUF983 domain-containing protein [Candidatus Puniceispirillaceae bacterium]
MPVNINPTEPDQPHDAQPEVPFLTVLRRGLARRCPNCGIGATLTGYLTRVPSCASCGIDLSEISADDGPAWATLIVVGHVLAPLMVMLGRDDRVPVWLAIVLLSVAMLAGVAWTLPRAKGLFIALIWRTGATGEDSFVHPASRDDGDDGDDGDDKGPQDRA